eukprot:GEMP01008043.1.p1 GENE.GEMP01008043.1~~GEMP01008043.1.p1  ORF type:complete len:560 (+),score=112.72 GEMP01008043.1:222-1901(+)
MDIVDVFHFFGVTAQSSLDDLRTSYKKKARESHPDKGGDAGTFQELQVFYNRVKKVIEERRAQDQAQGVRQGAGKGVKRGLQLRRTRSEAPANKKRVKVEPKQDATDRQTSCGAESTSSEHGESTTAEDAPKLPNVEAAVKCPYCSAVKACGATTEFSQGYVAKGAPGTQVSTATQATQMDTHTPVVMVDKAIQVGSDDEDMDASVADTNSHTDAGVNTGAPDQPATQPSAPHSCDVAECNASHSCDVVECNASSMNDIVYPADYFGPIGRRCAPHAPTSVRCNIPHCGNKAGNMSFCDTDDLGPRGLRCVTHGGTRVCSVPFCASKATTGTTKFTDIFGAPGPRCEVHFGGTTTCAVEGCTSRSFGNVSAEPRCQDHGGGFPCDVPYCPQPARCYHVMCSPDDFGPPGHRCLRHNTKPTCRCRASLFCPIDGCTLIAVTKSKSSFLSPISYCMDHGGELPVEHRCAAPDCTLTAVRGHVWPPRCAQHGGGMQCNVTNCSSVATNTRVTVVDEHGEPGFRCWTHGGRSYGRKRLRRLEMFGLVENSLCFRRSLNKCKGT